MEKTILINLPVQDFEAIIYDCIDKALKNNTPFQKPEFSDLPELLTRKQASKMLSISLGTLDGWSKEGRITKVRNGGIVRYRKTELLANFKSLKESRYSRNEKGGAKW